jgi:phosphohistidine phosphatase
LNLYLMQHGEATSEQENPDRPLTATGRAAVEHVAARARSAGVRLDRRFHSGKLRAAQSAELLATALGGRIERLDGLAPHDSVPPVAAWLRRFAEPIALVGHLPFLGKLASLLVAGDEQVGVVRFSMGGLICLAPHESAETFVVAWALPPEIA